MADQARSARKKESSSPAWVKRSPPEKRNPGPSKRAERSSSEAIRNPKAARSEPSSRKPEEQFQKNKKATPSWKPEVIPHTKKAEPYSRRLDEQKPPEKSILPQKKRSGTGKMTGHPLQKYEDLHSRKKGAQLSRKPSGAPGRKKSMHTVGQWGKSPVRT